MKILHVIAQLPSRTGSGVYFCNLIEGLKPHGHQQAALFAVQDGFTFDLLPRRFQYPVEFKSEHQIPFPIVGMSDVMPYESSVYSEMSEQMIARWRKEFLLMLTFAKAEFSPDILILHHLWMLTSTAAEVFPDEIKIGVCHNTDIRQARQHPDLKEMYTGNLPMLKAVLTLSDSQKAKIADTYGFSQDMLYTTGGGFNQEVFYPPVKKAEYDKVRLVYAAKIEQSKGIFELIKAFRNISQTHPNLHLDIIGTPIGDNELHLKSLIGDADNIAIIPTTCQKTLSNYIRERDIFVMPSYFEGLGLMAIECLACGLRVVSTEIEALIELLGDKVNGSGVIEYVKLPRIYDTDKPFEEDLPQFINDLSEKLLIQIERVENAEPIPDYVLPEIDKHSWSNIASRINDTIHTFF